MSTKTTNTGNGTSILTTIVSIVVVVILARACGGIVGRNAAERNLAERKIENSIAEPQANTVEDALAQFVRLASSGLPKMVDRITRLESVAIEDHTTVVETYTLTTLTKEELDVPGLTSDVQRKINSEFISSPKTKILRDYNVKWVWRYYDKNRQLILSVSSS